MNSNHSSPPPLSRRNFVLGVVNGALFIFGGALVEPGTVLPAYALDLTGTVMGVGLLASVISAGWNWPPVLFAGVMERTRSLMLHYRLWAVARVALAWALLWAVLGAGRGQPHALWLVAGLMLALSSAGGCSILAFMSVVSDTIPPRLRGRFFGIRYLLGGLLTLLGAWFVKRMLSEEQRALFPSNYGWLFGASALLQTLAVLAFSFSEEYPRRVASRWLAPIAQLRRGRRLLSRDPDYRSIVIARLLLWTTSGLALPFLVPFALDELRVDPEAVGIFLPVSVLAYSLSNVLWSYLSDGPGNRILLVTSGLCYLVVPAMGLAAPLWSSQPAGTFLGVATSPAFWWMLAVFVVAGVSRAGQMVGHTNYLLELSPERSRQTYLSFYYATSVPLSFLPVLGAVLIGEEGRYEIGFAITLLLSALMLWVLYGLREVREDESGTEGDGQ